MIEKNEKNDEGKLFGQKRLPSLNLFI